MSLGRNLYAKKSRRCIKEGSLGDKWGVANNAMLSELVHNLEVCRSCFNEFGSKTVLGKKKADKKSFV